MEEYLNVGQHYTIIPRDRGAAMINVICTGMYFLGQEGGRHTAQSETGARVKVYTLANKKNIWDLSESYLKSCLIYP